jgi:GNAT superfamily N-acetyltransferase
MNTPMKIIVGDISTPQHAHEMLRLLNLYMLDPMGKSASMNEELEGHLVQGLAAQPNYVLLLGSVNGTCVALANCFVNFSTFKAKPLLYIHDFVVDPAFRNRGYGSQFMNAILQWSKQQGHCRVNLEVRTDNPNAQKLYANTGFADCNPPMLFWEHIF